MIARIRNRAVNGFKRLETLLQGDDPLSHHRAFISHYVDCIRYGSNASQNFFKSIGMLGRFNGLRRFLLRKYCD